MQIFKEFVLGFWIWWYFERHLDLLKRISTALNGLAQRTRFDVSIRYLFVPLYQDKSATGLLFSLPVRITLLIFGAIMQVVGVILALLTWAVYLGLPLLPVLLLWLWAAS